MVEKSVAKLSADEQRKLQEEAKLAPFLMLYIREIMSDNKISVIRATRMLKAQHPREPKYHAEADKAKRQIQGRN